MSIYLCCDQRRRDAVRSSTLNGVDYLEVVDSDAPSAAERQRILRVNFLKSPAPPGLTPANVVISGGDRIRDVKADGVSYDGNTVVVHLNTYGDYSTYRLQFAAATGSAFNAASLDPQLSSVDFSFKVECPSEFDCKANPAPSIAAPGGPHIDYLARDYASFRQLMLDRLAVQAPRWRERNPADLGIALVELFAHVGDLLSYRQDAVATEAYLGTARRRVSVRRHARLVDYVMHEGANARAFVQVGTSADLVLSKGTQAFTALPGTAARLAPGSNELARARMLGPEIFETMHEARLFRAHNQI
ncbi:MAG: putative baseplate assembly protein, partial [Solimonas sp.]